ncbi:MAG: IPT/TIG domain-containing protein [Chitinophagaceae bacterium]|nr:IPT/TIG domain-containing protein [Chitinophagaceae bacterium]
MNTITRYLILSLFLFNAVLAASQSSLNYTTAATTTGSMAADKSGNPVIFSTEPNLVPNSSTNVISALQPIGFDFVYMGRYYTHFVAGSNGDLGLGIFNSAAGIIGATDNNDLTRTVVYPPGVNNAPVLAPFWDKMYTPSTGATVRTLITGTTPNRCRVIEWNTIINSSAPSPSPSARFQLRIYEGSGIIEYVYGNMSIVSASSTVTASIGFTNGLTDNQFLALQNLSSFPFTAIAAQEPATQSLVNTAVAGDIIGLHSLTEGQRRLFSFTAPALSGSAPSGFQITEIGATIVSLKWNDNCTNELGYHILVSSDNINFVTAGTTGPNSTFFTVGSLVLGNTYYFRVIAFTEGASLQSTNTLNATTSCLLNGSYTVGPGANYASLTHAIDSIRYKGVAGNVQFELTGSYTSSSELFPISFPKTLQVPCISNYRVTIRPQAAAVNLQIAGSNFTQLFLLDSASYVVFDGRPGGTGTSSQLSVINNSFGSVFRLNNASGNKFEYLKIGGSNTGPSVPEGLVHLVGSQGAGSDNNRFGNCEIYSTSAIPNSKNIMLSSVGAAGFVNDNDSIINCRFYDFAASGIQLSDYSNGWVISGNSFYNTATVNYVSDVAFIKISSLNAVAASHQVTNNYFGGTAANCQGNAMSAGYFSTFSFIDITGKAVVSNNYFRRVRLYNGSNSINNSVVNFILARLVPAQVTYVIDNNYFGSSSLSDSLHVSSNSSSVDMEVNGISMIGLGQVSNNRFSHLRCSSPVTRIMLKVISAGGNTDANIRNNAIGDPAIPNCIFNNSAGQTYGIGLLSVNSARVIGNTICRISSDNGNNNAHMAGIHMQGEYIDSIAYNTIFHLKNGNGGANGFQPLFGMRIMPNTSSGLANLIEGNHIYSLVQESVSSGGNVTGISAGVFMNLKRNFIRNLYTTNSAGFATIKGILMANNTGRLENNMISLGTDSLGNSLTAAGLTIYGIDGADALRHNSVYINGSNVANGNAGSTCMNATVNLTNCYNNIFFNARSNQNTGSAAIHSSVSVGVSYVSDYNMYFYSGTGGVLGIRSGTPYTALSAWRTATGVDANAIFSNPLFINPAGASNAINLHLSPGSPADAAGSGANTLVIDYDNETRANLTPVDIGADAFSGTPPVINSFTPTSGGTGTLVTISGSNLTGATIVRFGGTSASSFTVVNASTITAVVGSGSSGSVSVTTGGGSASLAGFTYLTAPVVSSFSPTAAGTGTTITISGSNFTGATVVRFGGTAASSFTVVNASTITAAVGSGASGAVRVITPGGTDSLVGFTFIPGPVIGSFTPVTAGAGMTVTITGNNFNGATAVSFGGTAATSFTVVNTNTITAVVGSGTSGLVSITTPGGTASLAGFTFIPAPVISSFIPLTAGTGTTVTISGNNFSGATTVSFGGTAASSFTIVNPTTITAVVGSGASGLVSVTTPGGTGSLAGFTFIPAPVISSFTPLTAGTGTTVTISGNNFSGATTVSFGGTAASSFTVVNATTITAVVGSGTSGLVSVTTPGGTASLAGFTFTTVTAVGGPGSVNSAELTVAPNPGDREIVIRHPSSVTIPASLRIVDVLGRSVLEIKTARNSTQTRLEIQQLGSGIYFIQWMAGARTLTRVFMKK